MNNDYIRNTFPAYGQKNTYEEVTRETITSSNNYCASWDQWAAAAPGENRQKAVA